MADIAWSNIQAPEGVIKAGETVNAGKMGLDKEAMDDLRESGAVRDTPYPKDIGEYESPREYNLRKVNEAVESAQQGNYVEVDFTDQALPKLIKEASSKSDAK